MVIDHITVRRESMRKLKDCIAIQGESVALQHRLLVIDLNVEKRKRKGKEDNLVEPEETRGRKSCSEAY